MNRLPNLSIRSRYPRNKQRNTQPYRPLQPLSEPETCSIASRERKPIRHALPQSSPRRRLAKPGPPRLETTNVRCKRFALGSWPCLVSAGMYNARKERCLPTVALPDIAIETHFARVYLPIKSRAVASLRVARGVAHNEGLEHGHQEIRTLLIPLGWLR